MTFTGAVVKEQGVSFAIVLVKSSAMQLDSEARETKAAFQSCFPGLPLILASQDSRGTFEYYGRPDIVKFLASIDADRIPWKKYTVD